MGTDASCDIVVGGPDMLPTHCKFVRAADCPNVDVVGGGERW